MHYDLIVIGGGPAGVAAGVYASRKQLRSVLIAKEWGGQSVVSPDIQNWIGTPSLSGDELAESLKTHLETYAEGIVDLAIGGCVTNLEKTENGFAVATDKNERYEARAVLIASGSHRRKLEVPGAAEFDQKGLTYCASCDGPLFSDQDVVVIGGGNAGFESAAQLLAYAKSVTLLQRSGAYKADPITVEKVLGHENMTGILNAEITEVKGDGFVTGITYTDKASGEDKQLAVTGVFVEIGLVPNTDFVEGLLDLDEYKRIEIDPWTQKTSVPGIWAAGDCTNIKYHQNNISAGDGVRALEDIYVTLRTK